MISSVLAAAHRQSVWLVMSGKHSAAHTTTLWPDSADVPLRSPATGPLSRLPCMPSLR